MSDFIFEPAKFIPFRDLEVIERCRKLTREELVKHPNPDFKISIHSGDELGMRQYADIVHQIVQARDEGRNCVLLLPNPWPGYEFAARILNAARIDCHHLWCFAMDEYADQDGNIAPPDWDWGFTNAMVNFFWAKIDPDLRPPREQFVGFTKENIGHYNEMMLELGGADCAYFGPGWSGHLAFCEPDAPEFDLPLEEWKKAGARICTLGPLTIAQNSLHGCFGASGDLCRVPPKAATVGPLEALSCKHRWSTHSISVQGSVSSWQRLTTRLTLHGPVTPRLPESILQTVPTTVYISEIAAMPIKQTWSLGY